MNKVKEYALYEGDNIIGVGSLYWLSYHFNIAMKTLYKYKSPSWLKTRREDQMLLVKLEEDDEE